MKFIEKGINNLGDFIDNVFNKYNSQPAFSCLGQTLSFTELDQKSHALACWFQNEAGLKSGDRIVIQLPNLIQYPIAAYAAARAGLTIVNTNPLYTEREMSHQFTDSGAKAIVILADLLPKFDAIKHNTEIETVIVTGATDLLTGKTETVKGCTGFSQAIKLGTGQTLAPRTQQLDDISVLQYTGGTTGVSKGAALSHSNVLSNAGQTLQLLGEHCGDGSETFISPLPLYHIYAFSVNMLIFFSKGNLNVLIPNPRDMDAFVNAIKPFQFTGFAGLNTLFVGLCQHPEFKHLDFSKFHLTLSGGTALTHAAADSWKSVTGCNITEGYGLSETAPVLAFNQPGAEMLGTVGQPLAGTEIEMRDDNGKTLAVGEEGELCAKGPQVMAGYWKRPEETAKVMYADGFFRTGDVGVILPNGNIKIVDRLKDMVIVSGFNVYPNEIEEILTGHPSIIEAAVVGEPDDKTGERVCAYIVVTSPVDEADIIAHCKKELTPYKVPKKIVVLDELPKSTVGKILRRELRG
jgi:long-chain acyl-CoA synthetase